MAAPFTLLLASMRGGEGELLHRRAAPHRHPDPALTSAAADAYHYAPHSLVKPYSDALTHWNPSGATVITPTVRAAPSSPPRHQCPSLRTPGFHSHHYSAFSTSD